MNLDYLNFYIIVPSAIFFYCLFEGYFSIQNITNFLHSYPLIATVLKLLGWVFLICLVLFLFSDTAYAMAPESSGSDLPKPDVKVTTGDNHNTLSINNSTFNIPDTVARGLTNIGTGAAVAGGMKAGASIAKASGFSPTAKIGVIAAGAFIGGSTVTVVNAIGSITQKKIDNAAVKSSTSPTTSTSAQASSTQPTPTSNTGGASSGDGSVAFSIEPSADFDTVMSLLNANHILHLCILYLSIALMILFVSTMIVEKK